MSIRDWAEELAAGFAAEHGRTPPKDEDAHVGLTTEGIANGERAWTRRAGPAFELTVDKPGVYIVMARLSHGTALSIQHNGQENSYMECDDPRELVLQALIQCEAGDRLGIRPPTAGTHIIWAAPDR